MRSRIETTELHKNNKTISNTLKALTYKHNAFESIEHTNGNCVICMDKSAIFAHTNCGCLTYCLDCRNEVKEHKVLSVWKCPRCRTLSNDLLRIYNLPSGGEDQ